MCLYLQHDASSAKFPIDAVTNCIPFPSNFCSIVPTTEQLIQNVFSQIATNYENHERLGERAIMAEKNNDVNAISNTIQGQISGKYTAYKSIDPIMNMDEIVNYPIENFNSLDIPGVPQHACHSKLVRP